MAFLTTGDGTRIYYKDLGDRRAVPFVLVHGWPVSSDAWDGQVVALLNAGFRVIAHDRRGHGRSEDNGAGHDIDTYADDLAELMGELAVRHAIVVGHGAGGGEVARYIGEYGSERVAKVVLVSAVPPAMLSTERWPGGMDPALLDGFRQRLAEDRSRFCLDLAASFFGAGDDGGAVAEGLRLAFWQQAMMGSVVGQHDCIRAFSETDFTDDLAAIDVPALIVHGAGDRIVPIGHAGALSVNVIPEADLLVYDGAPHGLYATHRGRLNADLIAFARRSKPTFFFE